MMTEQIVGLQLYTVRDETAKDFKQTLQYVAEMGYPAVEFAGYGNIASRDMAALLADFGLRAASTHVSLTALNEDLERELNYCLDIGCTFLAVPWIGPEWRGAEGFRKLAPRLNEIGRLSKERGITLAYHNHSFEFEQQDGKYLLDILLDATDPDLVKLELDTYWATFAGADAVTYLRAHSGRVPLVHLKDMTADRNFAEVGDGTLDIPGYYRAARESGTRYFIVENDAPSIPSLESARRSLVNLNNIINETV
jgi:sugar phosphate isomerase/epimerase